jgi:hypothetical protein
VRHGASVGLPLLKLLVAAGFFSVRRWTLVGAGILASMAVGCLIFLSQCGR